MKIKKKAVLLLVFVAALAAVQQAYSLTGSGAGTNINGSLS